MELTRISAEITAWLADMVRERLSPALALQFVPTGGWELRTSGSSRRVVITADAARYGRLAVALPSHAALWDPRTEGWNAPLGLPLPAPGQAALPQPLIDATPDGFCVAFDLCWFALWALSRGEEAASSERDTHGRFPAHAAHAHQLGYLDRPLVDEWFALLREVVQRTWPALPLTQKGFTLAISHDVDEPRFLEGFAFTTVLRRAAGDLLRRGEFRRGGSAPFRWMLQRAGVRGLDPYDRFDWMMQQAEQRGLRSTFHFLCGHTDARFDRDYVLSAPHLQTLLTTLYARGHAIGLHPSYGSHSDADAIRHEAETLRRHCAALHIPLPALTSRTHFLRWTTPETPRALAAAGVTSDCTLGYSEEVGFRCGTCHAYSAFDPAGLTRIALRLQPLIAMDITVLPGPYLNLPAPAARTHLTTLKNRCRAVGGCFTLCWHNSELDTAAKRQLFLAVLDA